MNPASLLKCFCLQCGQPLSHAACCCRVFVTAIALQGCVGFLVQSEMAHVTNADHVLHVVSLLTRCLVVFAIVELAKSLVARLLALQVCFCCPRT